MSSSRDKRPRPLMSDAARAIKQERNRLYMRDWRAAMTDEEREIKRQHDREYKRVRAQQLRNNRSLATEQHSYERSVSQPCFASSVVTVETNSFKSSLHMSGEPSCSHANKHFPDTSEEDHIVCGEGSCSYIEEECLEITDELHLLQRQRNRERRRLHSQQLKNQPHPHILPATNISSSTTVSAGEPSLSNDDIDYVIGVFPDHAHQEASRIFGQPTYIPLTIDSGTAALNIGYFPYTRGSGNVVQ